jgi:hypothetical protein
MASISSILNAQVGRARTARGTLAAEQNATGENSPRRIEQKIESTRVELSAQGQLKSAYADLQASAKAVSEPGKTAAVTDVRKAAKALVAAYNKALQATQTSDRTAARTETANTADRRPAAANELQVTLTRENSQAELNKAGITQESNGTLRLDEKVLTRALDEAPEATRTTLNRIGRTVERVAARDLGEGNGEARTATQQQTTRIQRAEVEQNQQQERVEATQRTEETQVAKTTTTVAGGLAAYRRMFPS